MDKNKKNKFQDDKMKKEPQHHNDINEKDPQRGSGSHDNKHQQVERERK